jgi:hypothetical protein
MRGVEEGVEGPHMVALFSGVLVVSRRGLMDAGLEILGVVQADEFNEVEMTRGCCELPIADIYRKESTPKHAQGAFLHDFLSIM